jgi:hypothetical protein
VVADPSHPLEFVRTQRSEVERPEGLPRLHSCPATKNFPEEVRRLEAIGTEFAQLKPTDRAWSGGFGTWIGNWRN